MPYESALFGSHALTFQYQRYIYIYPNVRIHAYPARRMYSCETCVFAKLTVLISIVNRARLAGTLAPDRYVLNNRPKTPFNTYETATSITRPIFESFR